MSAAIALTANSENYQITTITISYRSIGFSLSLIYQSICVGGGDKTRHPPYALSYFTILRENVLDGVDEMVSCLLLLAIIQPTHAMRPFQCPRL